MMVLYERGVRCVNLLVTGANGFIGSNLCQALLRRSDRLMKADVDTSADELKAMTLQADFVFHLAGVNRPVNESEFQTGNADFTRTLLQMLEAGKKPPVLLSGSIQATLENPYGLSKRRAEEALYEYSARTGAITYPYRLPNAFGKWSRPNYNSAVATFCYQIARGLPVTVSDPAHEMRLIYIDDIVSEFCNALDGRLALNENGYFHVLPEYRATLGQIVALLESFRNARTTLELPNLYDDFARKLYATYLSFLPTEEFSYQPQTHTDARGSFTELLHMNGYGQMSVNVQKPRVVKGEHWHDTKHEKFIVVAGSGVIRLRKVTGGEIVSYRVDGETPTVVEIPPGYTHNIENLGDTDMVTLMWASETFEPARPDTYHLAVEQKDDGRNQP